MGGLQQQQREEQPGLVAGEQPDQPVPGAGLAVGEGQRGDADVGVQVLVVGVGVVGVVLGDPPAEADPDQQVGVQQADPVVGGSGAGDLAVAGVVADKGELGEHHRQVGGGDQLPPGVPDDGEGGPAGGQQGQVEADPGGVPAAPALQQAGLFDLPRQLGVLTPPALGCQHRSSGRFLARSGHPCSSLSSSGMAGEAPPLRGCRGASRGLVRNRAARLRIGPLHKMGSPPARPQTKPVGACSGPAGQVRAVVGLLPSGGPAAPTAEGSRATRRPTPTQGGA